MYISKVIYYIGRTVYMLNVPARRAEHERNSQVLMDRERLERVLVGENETGKYEYNWNRPP